MQQDRFGETHALRRGEETPRSELAGAATADALIAATSYAKRGVVDLATLAGLAGVEGARIASRGVRDFSKGFLGRVRSRGSQRLQ